MKKTLAIITLLYLTAAGTFAANYESAMGTTLQKLYQSNSMSSYNDASAAFERIAEAEKDKWLPYYYAGLGCVWATHTVQDGPTIDALLDRAQVLVEKAVNLSPGNDEIITLQGYIYMMKVTVDPASRGPQYSGMAMQQFGQAVGINGNNPRALLLMGRMQLGTDQFFGSDTSQSCGMIKKAADMFETQQPKSAIDPAWGKEMAAMFVAECGGN